MGSAPSSSKLHEPLVAETRIVRTIKRGDTTYELYVGPCKCCRHSVFRLMRSCGASISVYDISPADYENLDDYVDKLHQSFAIDVVTRLLELWEAVQECNSRGLFEAEGMHPFRVRLIDKGRVICNQFSKNGVLTRLLETPDDEANDIVAAFILGCIATEIHWLRAHEEAVFEGYAHIEGRESGRPLALAARRRQGKRTRAAVTAAAAKLYQSDNLLRRNDSKTANAIADMKLQSLRKRDGTYLGADAIIKHLRATRAPANRKVATNFRNPENRL